MLHCRRVLKSLNLNMQKRAAGGHTWAMLPIGFAGDWVCGLPQQAQFHHGSNEATEKTTGESSSLKQHPVSDLLMRGARRV
jgi:hypothetical protein